jgi:hypothetical protein
VVLKMLAAIIAMMAAKRDFRNFLAQEAAAGIRLVCSDWMVNLHRSF